MDGWIMDASNGLARPPNTRASLPFDDEADCVALLQDALELGDPVGAGPLEGNLVGDADDLHGAGVTCYLAVGDRHHVIETQGLRCIYERKKKNVRYWILFYLESSLLDSTSGHFLFFTRNCSYLKVCF